MLLSVRFPVSFRHHLDGRVQRLAHPRADGKADSPRRASFSLLIPQPVHQLAFMTGRIPPVVIFLHRARQGRKRSPGHWQWLHLRRHIPISKLIRQYQSHLGPHGQHRLIPARPFIGSQRLFIPAFDDRGVLIHRGDALVCRALPHTLHQIAVHPAQSFQRCRFFRNIGNLVRQTLLFGLLNLLLFVKGVQKLPAPLAAKANRALRVRLDPGPGAAARSRPRTRPPLH